MSETPTRRVSAGLFSPATPRRSIRDVAADPLPEAAVAASAFASRSPVRAARQKHHEEGREFGGALGALALMLWSHYILYYFWYCLETAKGQLVVPSSVENAREHWGKVLALFAAKCVPTEGVWTAYGAFFVSQIVLAAVLPGMKVTGLGSDHNGNRLK